jgi:phosphoglycolate phosphatase
MNFDKIKYLAFDMDGTLFSSEEIILDTYIQSVKNFIDKYKIENLELPKKEDIINLVGQPVKSIFKSLLPELNEIQRDEISDSVLALLIKSIEAKKGILYEGVVETIEYLKSKNKKLLIASNGRIQYIQTILKTYKLLPNFEDIITINYDEIKTKGDILAYYKKKYQISEEEILMIGDRDSDFQAAKFIQCPFAYCSFGHANRDEVPNFEIELKTISDLKNLF